jgi:hypothetical protein
MNPTGLGSLLSRLDAPSTWHEIAPRLALTESIASRPPRAKPALGYERERLLEEGYACLPGVLDREEAAELAFAVRSLVEAGIPPLFAYVYDEMWAIARRLEPAVQALVGPGAALLEDFWAWLIQPGHAGWRPHRGWSQLVRQGGGPPALLNVWIALTDVGAEDACMAIVPICDDPSYPDALERVHAPLERARALPVAAGTALAWDANALHWSARSSRRANARISASFNFRLPGGPALDAIPAMDLRARLDLRRRLDLIAEQIERYETNEDENQLPMHFREWAHVTSALRRH